MKRLRGYNKNEFSIEEPLAIIHVIQSDYVSELLSKLLKYEKKKLMCWNISIKSKICNLDKLEIRLKHIHISSHKMNFSKKFSY